MVDSNNNQQNNNQQISTQAGLTRESEPMPVGANLAELSEVEKDLTEVEHSPEVSDNSSQAKQVKTEKVVEAKDAIRQDVKISGTNPKQYPLTRQQAQKIVKGPLFLKNSSDPMLWLALLMVRHYQWLDRKEKEKKK